MCRYLPRGCWRSWCRRRGSGTRWSSVCRCRAGSSCSRARSACHSVYLVYLHSEQPLPGSPGVEVNILVPAYPHHGVEVDAVTGGRALDGWWGWGRLVRRHQLCPGLWRCGSPASTIRWGQRPRYEAAGCPPPILHYTAHTTHHQPPVTQLDATRLYYLWSLLHFYAISICLFLVSQYYQQW